MKILPLVCLALAACVGGGGGGADPAATEDGTTTVDDTATVEQQATATAQAATTAVGPYFTKPMFWNTDVSALPKSAVSDKQIAALAAAGGWGNGNKLQIDFGLDVLTATATTPHVAFEATDDWYDPDCDTDAMPLPAGGNVEGESGYTCTEDGDCHLLVNDPAHGKLFEMWRANKTDKLYGGCLAVWKTAQAYTRPLRGMQCTSADAAGLPIAPLLFTADDIKRGSINHAIRFVLPNNRLKKGFVAPATHGTATSGGANAPAYGVHLRLRANYPVASLPTAGARVVARAMQKYGMVHADGGNIALTAQSDRHTAAKWAGLLGSHDLAALKITDFEVIDHGAATPLTYDCVRQ